MEGVCDDHQCFCKSNSKSFRNSFKSKIKEMSKSMQLAHSESTCTSKDNMSVNGSTTLEDQGSISKQVANSDQMFPELEEGSDSSEENKVTGNSINFNYVLL
jgi:hypothetical protein